MKIKKTSLKLLPLAALLVAALLVASGQASALEFHGYLRSGWGISSAGGSQQCFQLPGSPTKYRLGNECETYSEMNFAQTLYEGKDDVKFDYHGTLAYRVNTDNQHSYESFVSNTDSTGKTIFGASDIALRENWVEAKNIPFLGGASAWAGQRFYKRQDIHIIDFWFTDMSGTGGGIENLPLGPGKFSYAILGNSTPAASLNLPYSDAVLRHTFNYQGVSLGEGNGELEFAVVLNQPSSKNPGHEKGGSSFLVEHFIGNVLGGYNKLALSYGEGGDQYSVPYPSQTNNTSNSSWQLAESFQWQVGQFSGMADAVYASYKDNYSWLSLGVRPVWHVSKYFKWQFELGHDEVKESSNNPDTSPTGHQRRTLDKITIAPTIVAGDSFWSRPELRLYYTYAKWNEAARDNWGGVAGGTGGVFGRNTNGSSYGIQLDAWW